MFRSKILVLASYCGDDNEHCTDDNPCKECLDMCNVFEINLSDTKYKYVGMFSVTKQGYRKGNGK